MQPLTRLAAGAFLLALTTISMPAIAEDLQIVSEGPASQMLTQALVVHSGRLDRDFVVQVFSPPPPLLGGRRAPVIYALDDGLGLVNPIGQFHSMSGAAGPATLLITRDGAADAIPQLGQYGEDSVISV